MTFDTHKPYNDSDDEDEFSETPDPLGGEAGPRDDAGHSVQLDPAATNQSSEQQDTLNRLLGLLEHFPNAKIFPCHSIVKGNWCTCGKRGVDKDKRAPEKDECGSPGKHPRVRWTENASRVRSQIEQWVEIHPTANWGLVTGRESGVWVMDIDPRHGGRESLAKLQAEIGELDTLTTLTGGGGLHLYFAYPDLESGITVRSRTNWMPGIDIKSDGGYVVLPPSNHFSGGHYSWFDHGNDDPPGELGDEPRPEPTLPTRESAPAPLDLIESINSRERDNSSGSADSDDSGAVQTRLFESIPEGQRNDEVFKRACELARRLGASQGAVDAITGILSSLLDNPATFSDNELRTTVQSAIKSVQQNQEYEWWRDLPNSREIPDHVVRALKFQDGNEQATELRRQRNEDQAKLEIMGSPVPISAREHLALAGQDLKYNFTIPGRIVQASRIIVTAGVGVGKSTALRYIGGAAAAGVDPFDWTCELRYEPKRVLVIDCENGYDQTCMRVDELAQRWDDRIEGTGDLILDNFSYMPEEDFGLPLMLDRPRDAARLRHWIEDAKPDLLLIGPAYHLSSQTGDHEQMFSSITGVLDALRGEFGFSTIMEAHTPHSQNPTHQIIRPSGAHSWTRWPEIGFHIADSGAITQWRPSRYGTDISLPEWLRHEPIGQVMFHCDPPTVGEITQERTTQAEADLVNLLKHVAGKPGIGLTELTNLMGCGYDRRTEAIRLGEEKGLIEVVPEGNNKRAVYLV